MNSKKIDEWFPQFDKLIQMIKQYPITYRNYSPKTKEYKTDLDIAWNDISRKLCMQKRSCKQLWKNIKFRYAKIKLLLNSGKLTDEDIQSYKETSRYFDGTLSFIDPHISEITEATIPPHIHNQVNKIFNIKDSCAQNKYNSTPVVTHEQVIRALGKKSKEEFDYSDYTDVQRLQNLIKDVIKRKLSELFTVNVISEPDPDSQTPNEEMGLQSELIIEENIIKEESDNITQENFVQMESDYENESKIKPSININDEIVNDGDFNLSNNNLIAIDDDDVITMITEDKTNNTNVPSRISDINMKKFFNELGEVMNIELSKEKQMLLKQRLNSLLRNISEQE